MKFNKILLAIDFSESLPNFLEQVKPLLADHTGELMMAHIVTGWIVPEAAFGPMPDPLMIAQVRDALVDLSEKELLKIAKEHFPSRTPQSFGPASPVEGEAESRPAAALATGGAGSSAPIAVSSVIKLITEVSTVSVGEELVNMASENGCDAIIMSSHGRGAIRSLFLGSCVQQVLRTAHCAVVVLRAS